MNSVTRATSGAAQPVGPEVDAAPAEPPGPAVLVGRFGRVDKLDAARDGAGLWNAMREPALWTYLPYGPFADAAAFSTWLGSRQELQDPYYYSIKDTSGRALGVATLMEIRPKMRVIEVGHICLGTPLQRTPLATEAIYLLARYAFETLRYRRFEWKCHALNAASRRAAERFGFAFEGIFKNHMIVKGRSRDTAWYAMLDSDWPRCRAAFERWLAADNFDGTGRQRRRLEQIRNTL